MKGVTVRRVILGAGILILSLVVLSVVLNGLPRAEAARPQPKPAVPVVTYRPTIIGHRGASVPGHVENTLGAFRYAAANGTTVIETDIYWTADGIPVISHDATLDRMTNCSGRIDELTWPAIKAMGCRVAGTDELVEPLARGITVARHTGVQLLLHLGPRTVTFEQGRSILTLLNRGQMTHRTIVQSFFHGTFRPVRAADHQHLLRFAVLSSKVNPTPDYVRSYSSNTVVLPYTKLTAGDVSVYRRAGIKVWVWTTTDVASHRAALLLRPNAIITDDPAGLHRIIR